MPASLACQAMAMWPLSMLLSVGLFETDLLWRSKTQEALNERITTTPRHHGPRSPTQPHPIARPLHTTQTPTRTELEGFRFKCL